jgi:L-lysine 2,3-aminomutase
MKPLMITPDAPGRHLEPWRQELAAAVTDPGELLELLGLDPGLLPAARNAARHFGLRVPHSYIARMRRGDPDDPLLRQVLPLATELVPAPDFGPDPVGDLAAARVPGVLAKYHGRALLVTTGACAVHCRYCFRREYPYPAGTLTPARLQGAIDTLAADPTLEEVILSGGDPLSLPTRRLAQLTTALDTLPRLRRLRIHTRTPVVLPARVDAALLGWLRALPWRSVVVLHVNHPRELSDEVMRAAAALADAGACLLNQSVLLRGVNDDADTLVELSQRLFDTGIQPYYLHLLDRVSGTAHFDVPEPEARTLQAQLMARLPGYLVPRMVRELAGAPSKTPVHVIRELADRC